MTRTLTAIACAAALAGVSLVGGPVGADPTDKSSESIPLPAPHLSVTLDRWNPSGTGGVYAVWRDPPDNDWVSIPYTLTNKGSLDAPDGAALVVKRNNVVIAFRREGALAAGASRKGKLAYRLDNHNVKWVDLQLIIYPNNTTTMPADTFSARAEVLQTYNL